MKGRLCAVALVGLAACDRGGAPGLAVGVHRDGELELDGEVGFTLSLDERTAFWFGRLR